LNNYAITIDPTSSSPKNSKQNINSLDGCNQPHFSTTGRPASCVSVFDTATTRTVSTDLGASQQMASSHPHGHHSCHQCFHHAAGSNESTSCRGVAGCKLCKEAAVTPGERSITWLCS
jgi:hypothetical protein